MSYLRRSKAGRTRKSVRMETAYVRIVHHGQFNWQSLWCILAGRLLAPMSSGLGLPTRIALVIGHCEAEHQERYCPTGTEQRRSELRTCG